MEQPGGRPVALVTGGGSGIGAAVARALGASGLRCVLVGRRADRLAEVATQVEAAGGSALGLPCDLVDLDAVEALVPTVVDVERRLDVLVTCAGAYEPSPFTTVTAAHLTAASALLHHGPVLLTTALARHATASGRPARAVHTTSVTAFRSRGCFTAYESAKAALVAATRSLAVELAPQGVTVNSVAPGWVATDMADVASSGGSASTADEERLRELIPVGRTGTPEELAEVVRWLAVDAPTFLTAQTLVVDGGQSARTGSL